MSLGAGWRQLVARWRSRPGGEIDEELASHLEHAAQAYVDGGMPVGEARRRAAVDFGSLGGTRAQAYEQRPFFLLETVVQDVRYSLRTFRRERVFTLTVIVTLMLGLGATTAVFSAVDRILFRSLPYGQADRLVSVGLTAPIDPDEFMLGSSYFEWQDHQRAFSAMTSETGVDACDLTEERPVRLNCGYVQRNFLSTLGVSTVAGRNFTEAEDTPHGPKVALISASLWLSRYNKSAAAIGSMLHLDGRAYEIVGVLPAGFEMPRMQKVDVLIPQALDVARQRSAIPGRVMWAFARLKPGVTEAEAKVQLEPLFEYSLAGTPPQFRKEVHLRVRSLRDRQMQHVQTSAWILFGLVLALLLIACANVASLMLARATQRMREQAVRAALGASRWRLMQQALVEAGLLGLGGAIAGVALASVLLQVFRVMTPTALPFLAVSRVDGRVIGFAGLAGVLCSLLLGAALAFRVPDLTLLGGRGIGTRAEARMRRALVIGQVAVSLFLLVGSFLLARSFARLEDQRLGFDAHNLVTMTISLGEQAYPTDVSRQAFFSRLERNLRYGPGVTGLAMSDTIPPGGEHHDQIFASIMAVGHAPASSGTGGRVTWRWVTPEYFKLLKIPVLLGQGFTADEMSSPNHYVVLSRSLAARLFAGENPIDRQVHLAVGAAEADNPAYIVAGVVDDVKNGGLADTDEPEYYRLRRNAPADWDQTAIVTLETGLPLATIEPWMRAQVAAVDPRVPVQIGALTQAVAELADKPRFTVLLAGLFAVIGLVLTAVGLYGVVAFLVAQRTQEIGIRLALGASRRDILGMVVKGSLRMIVPGVLLGLVLSALLSRVLADLLYGVSPRDPVSLIAAAVLMSVLALVATVLPTRAAVRVDPNVALRNG